MQINYIPDIFIIIIISFLVMYLWQKCESEKPDNTATNDDEETELEK